MLTTCTTSSVGINTDIIRLDFNFRIVLNFRHNIAGRKRGLPSACAVEGRHTHQTVNPLLGFQIAIGIFAVHLNGNGFQSGFIAVQHIQYLNLEAFLLRPSGIHAEKHICPVTRLCAARPCMQGNNGIVAVIFAIEHCCNAQCLIFRKEGIVHFLYFFIYAVILLLDAHFDECQNVLVGCYKAFIFADLIFQCFQLLQCFLALFQIIPEIGVCGKLF